MDSSLMNLMGEPPDDQQPKKGNRKKIEKTQEQIDREQRLYFELPRKTCEQMVPSLLRLKLNPSRKEQQRKLFLFKKMLKRNRLPKVNHIMQHIIEFDKSEGIIPHGEVSKRIYVDITKKRDFDLYGRQIPPMEYDEITMHTMKNVAKDLGVEYTQTSAIAEEKLDVVNIFGDTTLDLKAPPIQTALWKVGTAAPYPPPPGFSRNPAQPYKAEGNEVYYSYDGDWENGQLSGWGLYLYEDGLTYKGMFKKNRPWGEGKAIYGNGNEYDGQWVAGRYDGRGVLTLNGGSEYDGEFILGRRHGKGKLVLDCGLEYDGDWCDGRPHGRGVMKSKLTNYAYEGTFVKGSICGTGTIILPNRERIIQYFPPTANNEILTLPMAIRSFVEDRERVEAELKRKSDETYGQLRGIQLRDYVNNVRTSIHNERTREKRERQNEHMAKVKEQKAKLLEARLKALAGDDD